MASTTTAESRFNDYLNALQNELDPSSTIRPNPQRFNIYLTSLKGEFQLMVLEIESLRKEIDELKAKLDVGCEQCSKTLAIPPPPLPASSFKLSIQPKPLDKPQKPNPSPTPSQNGAPTDKPKRQRPTGFLKRVQSVFTASPAKTKKPKPQKSPTTHLQVPTLSRLPSSTNTNPGVEPGEWSLTYNDQVQRAFAVEDAHLFFHAATIECVKFSPDGRHLATACSDGKAYIYDVESGGLSCLLRNLLVERVFITALSFSHDAKYLATSSLGGQIYIWEISTKYVRNAFKGHKDCTNSLDFSPDDRRVVSASDDDSVVLWNMRFGFEKALRAGVVRDALDSHCYTSALFSPDGKHVAASHNDGTVRVWSVGKGTIVRRLAAGVDWVNDLAFFPDGSGLVSGGRDRTLRCFDVSDVFEHGVEDETWGVRHLIGHKHSVYSVAISPDGKWIGSGSHDRTIRIWDSKDATLQCTLDSDHEEVWTVDFSPMGNYFASGGRNGTARIWRYWYY